MHPSGLIRRYGLGLAQKVEQRLGWSRADASANKVYMFHSIDASVDVLQPCSITRNSFEKWLIHALSREEFYSLSDIENVHSGSFITFDDIYQSVVDNAVPLLEKHGVPFTCFVAVGYLDEPGYISTSTLRHLAASPLCTIGAHTLTHPLLSSCDAGQSLGEIKGSKEKLQEILAQPVTLFAYPYGSMYACSKRDRNHAGAAGFEFAFSTVNRPVGDLSKEDRWFLPRINVVEGNWERY